MKASAIRTLRGGCAGLAEAAELAAGAAALGGGAAAAGPLGALAFGAGAVVPAPEQPTSSAIRKIVTSARAPIAPPLLAVMAPRSTPGPGCQVRDARCLP